MTYTDIDHVRKTMKMLIFSVELEVALFEQCLEFLHHFGIVLSIIESKMAYLNLQESCQQNYI